MLVVIELAAKGITHRSARLSRDQRRCADIPLITPSQRGDQIGLISGDHGNPERNRIGLINTDQISIGFGQIMCRHPRPGKFGAARCSEACAIAACPLACLRLPKFAARRRCQHTDERPPLADQRDRDSPPFAPANEISCAIDRINQPDQRMIETARIIRGFLRQPAGRRQQSAQLAFQKRIHGEIRLAHRAARGFLPAFDHMARPRPLIMRDPASFGHNGFQTILIDHG